MTITSIDDLIIAAHMRALSILLEGEDAKGSRILTQACIGFDPDIIGERCRLIDAADTQAIVAIFDPDDIARGPVSVGICARDQDMVRLYTGQLWLGSNGQAALVAEDSYLTIEAGRFVRRSGRPTADLTRGRTRARRRLAELVAVRSGEGVFMLSMG